MPQLILEPKLESNLTPKQERLYAKLDICSTTEEAMLESGYSPNTARTQNTAGLHKVRKIRLEQRKETADSVIEMVSEVARDSNATYSDKLRACELLGKYLGIWTDRTVFSVELPKQDQLIIDSLTTLEISPKNAIIEQKGDSNG